MDIKVFSYCCFRHDFSILIIFLMIYLDILKDYFFLDKYQVLHYDYNQTIPFG